MVIASTGCAAFDAPFERPTIEVKGVAITSVGFTGIECEVFMSIFNPNGFGVPLDRGTWDLRVGNADAVSGEFQLSQTIPAKQSAPITTQIRIDARDAIAVASEVAAGTRSYTIRGQLHFSTSLGELDVAFSHTGDLDEAHKLIGVLR